MISCTHLDAMTDVPPGLDVCEDCLPIGGRWVHLRQCLTCGVTRCCDNSPNRHATAHYHASGHPIVRAITPVGEDWMWCYPDELLFGEEDGELVEYGFE
jgi:hypothetical protein